MRKLLERYIEAKRLFDQTTKVVEEEMDEDFRKAAVEIAEGELRVAHEQLSSAIREHGLPSIEATLTRTQNNNHLFANKARMNQWLQERANRERRAQFIIWEHGEVLRASPQRATELPISVPPPAGHNTAAGM